MKKKIIYSQSIDRVAAVYPSLLYYLLRPFYPKKEYVVEKDQRTEVITTTQKTLPSSQWPLVTTNILPAHSITKGEGVKIGIFDSGIDFTHKEFQPSDYVQVVQDVNQADWWNESKRSELLKDIYAGKNPVVKYGKNFTTKKKVEDFWDNMRHGCVSEDTLVQTSLCGIEEIKTLYDKIDKPEILDSEGHWVKDVRNLNVNTLSLDEDTGKSRVSQVQFLHRVSVEGPVVSVELSGDFSYLLTPWHPVILAKHSHGKRVIYRKRADELEVGDEMVRRKDNTRVQNSPASERKIFSRVTSVKSIRTEDFSGDFYDFTVDRDHNYIANGHFVSNTSVASIISAQGRVLKGVAPQAEVYIYKVVSGNGFGFLSTIARALEDALYDGIDIATFSLAFPFPSKIMGRIVEKCNQLGMLVIAATGNNAKQKYMYPAATPGVIAVGGCGHKGGLWKEYEGLGSNWGSHVQFICPAAAQPVSLRIGSRYTLNQGTSLAAPHFAGICALVLSILKNKYKDTSQSGDVTRDGEVDIMDLVRLGKTLGEHSKGSDMNEDGTVDIRDLIEVGKHFGEKKKAGRLYRESVLKLIIESCSNKTDPNQYIGYGVPNAYKACKTASQLKEYLSG